MKERHTTTSEFTHNSDLDEAITDSKSYTQASAKIRLSYAIFHIFCPSKISVSNPNAGPSVALAPLPNQECTYMDIP